MVVTENELRIHWMRRQTTPFRCQPDDFVTQTAKDFAREHGIRLVTADGTGPADGKGFVDPTGQRYREKPEHMTSLGGNVLVPKTHPRIALRGELDGLQAVLLRVQFTANRQFGIAGLTLIGRIQEVLDFVRAILASEVKESPFVIDSLFGVSLTEVRDRSHQPPGGHYLPQWQMGETALELNLARTVARRAELAAARAFISPEGGVERADLMCALNRVSSALYLLSTQARDLKSDTMTSNKETEK